MKIIISILCLCFSLTTLAQDYKFGKVSKEELQEKFNPLDSSASAIYLYKYRKTYFEYSEQEGFELVTDIHERIKIYNPEGFDYATKAISLYKSSSDKEEVNSLKAHTYNLVNGKIEDTKLEKKGIFKTEKSKYRNETKFTMPNIKEGSVIEYKYRIDSPFYSNIDEFVFQYDIPVKKIEAIFETPEYFNFKVNTKGFFNVIPKKETKRDKIAFVNKTRTRGSGTTFSSNDVEFTKNVSLYNLSNIPALKDEPYVNNINNYRSVVDYELSYTEFPNSPVKYFSTTWEDVVKTIYDSSDFGNELEKTGYFESDIDALIANVSDPMEKVVLIFNYVKSHVKWNEYYGKYTSDGVKNAYKEHTGNVAEINLMLTSMLRYAGLNANPILISTRSNGIPLFPTRQGYNYVISGIEVQNDVILLDATSKYSMPNILPLRALNWQGRIIRKSGSSALVDLYPKNQSKNNTFLSVTLTDDGGLEGSMRSIKTGYKAMAYRVSYNGKDEDTFIEALENKNEGMEINEFSVKNNLEIAKPVAETCSFSLESQADVINDKIYFSPLFFLKSDENPFKLEKREFAIDFVYPSTTKYTINIKLPEGYAMESLPEPKILQLPDNLGKFTYNIIAKTGLIQLVVSAEIKEPIISAFYYDALKQYFSKLIEAENEQVVLTRM